MRTSPTGALNTSAPYKRLTFRRFSIQSILKAAASPLPLSAGLAKLLSFSTDFASQYFYTVHPAIFCCVVASNVLTVWWLLISTLSISSEPKISFKVPTQRYDLDRFRETTGSSETLFAWIVRPKPNNNNLETALNLFLAMETCNEPFKALLMYRRFSDFIPVGIRANPAAAWRYRWRYHQRRKV